MGNCLKINSSDNISLLRSTETNNIPDFIEEERNITRTYSMMQPIFFPTETGPAAMGRTSQQLQQQQHHQQQQQQITEEEQIKLSKRLGLIQHLPIGIYDGSLKKSRECVICMLDFCVEEPVRYLPCMHIYHVHCIDDWLMRSLTCPSCMEPVDAALLNSYETI